MGKGLLAPTCKDTYKSLLSEHSEDLALCLVSKWTNTKLNPKWNTVQENLTSKHACKGEKAELGNTEH